MKNDFTLTQRHGGSETQSFWGLGHSPSLKTLCAFVPLCLCVKIFIAAFFGVLCNATANALPLEWRADWPDCKPVEKYVHRGTDIELQPTWYINGELAATSNWTYSVYVQTNNQATGEWFGPIPGTTFSHTNDVGAAMYQVMLRAQTPGGAVNYTAFARLRMLDSPGFRPGTLPLPVASIDFSEVVAINAPWLLPDATNATLQAARSYADGVASAATNYADTVSTLNDRPLPTTWVLSPSTVEWNGETISVNPPEYGDYNAFDGEGYGWYYNDQSFVNINLHSDDPNAAYFNYDFADTPITATRTQPPGYILGAQSNKVVAAQTALSALSDTLATNYYTIAETDDAIDALAAYYITSDDQGSAFATYASLTNATVFYSGGFVRTPTRNDYCVVLADETHGGAEWRYIYTVAAGATSGQWEAQYPIETNDYEALSNLPQINGFQLFGNKTGADLGLATPANVAAAALSATNYTDAAISPTSPAFSNAVLSVGLGIDTNTVAVINELVDSAHDLPVSGATSVGALLLALAAAVAALKKNLRYSYNAATVSSGTTPTVTDLADRAINTATLGSSVTAATVTLPAATANRARDFFIDLTIEATTAPTLTFIDPATNTTANVTYGADSLADIDTGKNAVLFTEFPNYTWIVSVKHEEVTE